MTISALPKAVPTFEQSLVALPAKLNNVPRDYRELKSLFIDQGAGTSSLQE
jgi:hypothetical protein